MPLNKSLERIIDLHIDIEHDGRKWGLISDLEALFEPHLNRAVVGCFCPSDLKPASYEHVVGMKKPFKEGWKRDVVPVDVCIATEIAELWHKGVITLNSCCGHGKRPANVVVPESEVEKMEGLGYMEREEIPSGLPCFLLKTGTIEANLQSKEQE